MTNFVVTSYSGRSYDELCCNEFHFLCYYEARRNGLLYLMLPPVCTTLSQKESQYLSVHQQNIHVVHLEARNVWESIYKTNSYGGANAILIIVRQLHKERLHSKKWILKSKHFWAMSQKTKWFIEVWCPHLKLLNLNPNKKSIA